MKQAIVERISRRNFEKATLSSEEITTIRKQIKKLNQTSQLNLEFLEDGSEAFANLKKSYGLFTNVRSLVLMKGSHTDPLLKEKIGYYGEVLVLEMTKLGLGTCWVGGTFDPSKLKVAPNEDLVAVVVVGKVKATSLKEKMIRSAISKKRKPIAERLMTDTDSLPSWLIDGIEAVRLAPSAKNSQKAIFHYREGIISAQIANDYDFDLVDLGIAKKHFEIGAGGQFQLGNDGTFELSKKQETTRS